MEADVPPTQTLNLVGDWHIGNHPPKDIKNEREPLVYSFQLPSIMPRILTSTEKEILLNPENEGKADENQHQDKKLGGSELQTSGVNPESELENPAHDDIKSAIAFPAQYPNHPVGQVGKLRVHDSGRVMATWGGLCLCRRLGVGRDGAGGLLLEVMVTYFERTLVKVEEGKEKGKERWEERISLEEGGWAVGQLGEGFVMVPDWGRITSRA